MIKAYAALKLHSALTVTDYDPGPLRRQDVEIDLDYCGVYHSDLSMINNEWGLLSPRIFN